MISGIGSLGAFSGLSNVSGVKPVSQTPSVTPKQEDPKTENTPASSAPLQSVNALQLPAAALAILQENPGASAKDLLKSNFVEDSNDLTTSLLGGSSSNSDNILSSLLGGNGNASQDLFNSLLESAATQAAPLAEAINASQQAQANTKAQSSPVQSLLSSLHTGTNAYNAILQQTAQNVLQAGETLALTA